MQEILTLLSDLKIPFQRFDHKAVFTCAESEGLHVEIPGAHTKQLLMKGKRKKQYVLAIVMHDKRVDTKALAKEFGDQSMSFVSPEDLKRLLGVEPGSVTPFGLIYDKAHEITVIVDEDAWNIGQFRFHPLTNTATLVIDKAGFETFMKHTEHQWSVRVIPNREQVA
jgi:Ala-tRNA(Pro) deacylase